MSTILLIGGAVFGLGVSVKKDKERTLETMKNAKNMMKSMLSDILGVLLLIGLILALLPPEVIERYIGEASGFMSVVLAALLGTITLIPAFVAFPLVGSLKDSGAGMMTLTAFLTTLTMVGFVTFPLEKQAFGFKFAFTRNVLSFIFAVLIAVVIGGVFA